MPATISLRVPVRLWTAHCDELLAFLEPYLGTITEAALFTGETHPPLPLAVIEERARIAGGVLDRLRSVGMKAGFNHLSTFGHIPENLDNSLCEPWQRMITSNGEVSEGTFCVSDPRVMDYVRKCYSALAGARPEFIWIDDDVRLEGRFTSGQLCFCELCLQRFSGETGRAWTREALVAMFQVPNRDERFEWRRRWLAHNRVYLGAALAEIRDAVHAVDPRIDLGLMTVDMAYSGYGFAEWAKILAADGTAVKWRPGSGFYQDHVPAELISKAVMMGRQNALVPDFVTDIQYEHENFPYYSLGKSATMFCGEVAAAVGAGSTGVALNCLSFSGDPLDEYRPWLDSIVASEKFLDRAVDLFGRSTNEGVVSPFTTDNLAILRPDGDWLNGQVWGGHQTPLAELARIGFPLAFRQESGTVTLLSGDAVLQYEADELRSILSGGVLLDGDALRRLDELGLGRLTGFTADGTMDRDVHEAFTDDELNGQARGLHRDCRQSFYRQTATMIEPVAVGTRVLANLVDYGDKVHGICAGAYENELGGRVVVLGYYPWTSLLSLAKTTQLKSIMRWLSRDTLPAYVGSHTATGIWARRDAKGLPTLMLGNASLDRIAATQVYVLAGAEAMQLTRMDGTESRIGAIGRDGRYVVYSVADLGPWEFCLLSA